MMRLITWLLMQGVMQAVMLAVILVLRPVMAIEQNHLTDLQRQLPAEELLQLSAQQENFLVLQRDTLTSYTKGTAILIPDSSEHPASPKHIDHLRQQLPLHGWHTLALIPPQLNTPLVDQNQTDYHQQMLSRLQAVQQQALKQPGSIIIIAQGNSAAVVNRLLADGQLAEPVAFVMLGAYLSDPQLNRRIADALAQQQVATLELAHQFDNPRVAQQLLRRQQLANKALKAVYRQRQLSGSAYHADVQVWVLKEIVGWLGSMGL
ncbi:DUF3530 family protein [Rheinheimera nanhaiensis]|uniref:DUF3530 family protein n=1 Tax=Rheinheimera nanhaiensis E407-8 TaxID=562729 RepID=I1DXV2_9GAMM|nr:DUF3530 family protein [Rheinheimera nanhaiensis]GAB58880.1 hypothetical protein RNAN_1868 [Rheinheimera nanhaiensis E407-8]